ncbi:substance-K receptor-like [Anabrus simplex]|uniref:substance-K receptor-like n=1 Tax=Anabrus simplex TaxID=316456 RepID=UPI0035A28A14
MVANKLSSDGIAEILKNSRSEMEDSGSEAVVSLLRTKMCMTHRAPYTKSDCPAVNNTAGSFNNCTNNNSSLPWINQEIDTHNGYHPSLAVNGTLQNEFNFSYYDFPNEVWYQRADWEIAAKVMAFLPFVLVGIFANCIILNVVLRNRYLRTPTNMILANMAAADLATLLFCPTIFVFTDAFQNYVLGEFGCKTEGFFNCSLLMTAVLNVVAVSYDRLTVITLPREARLSPYGTHIIIIGSWCVGLIVAIPLVIYRTYKERQWKNFLEKYCTENVNVLPFYWDVIIVLIVWLPLTIMGICYTTIFVKLDQYEQELLKKSSQITVRYKTRVARTMFILLMVFICCRVPYTALIFRRNQLVKDMSMNQVDDSFRILWFASRYLIFINAAINPIIYGLTNENFRRAIRQMEFSKKIFGSNTSNEVTPPRPKKHVHIHREVYTKQEEKESPQHWFTYPEENKVKTLSTECYM